MHQLLLRQGDGSISFLFRSRGLIVSIIPQVILTGILIGPHT
jgi:hypothetical protein